VRTALLKATEAGARLDQALGRVWPDLSRSRLQGLIGQGRLSMDGLPVRAASAKAQAGRVYRLTLPPPEPPRPQPEAIPLAVVYEDADLIVIDKPAGMAAHPAAGSLTGTVVHALLHHCAGSLSGIGGEARPGVVHRIDKDTTGLIVAAKNDLAHQGLAAQFAAHSIERAYYAVTRGAPPDRSGVIDTRLARSPDDRRKQKVLADPNSTAGKRAITHYWVVERFGQARGGVAGRPAAALLECRLETGRTHQIRAHLAHVGAPLIGDPLYGKDRGLKAEGSGSALETALEAARAFPRQALHAGVLGFSHPRSGARLRFTAPLPPDLETLLQRLRAL
jgi:23S rRNA pseudouridine1911/1915/1917 synthase